ncbi:MAG: hypothetical protein AAFV59_04185 [Pseudomonadota bacterium]
MIYTDMMNEISFAITPSPETNDHEVRILIDGEDWLGEDQMGMDPPELFRQISECNTGKLLVGRCHCGVVGCGDLYVYVTRDESTVRWQVSDTQSFRFGRIDYNETIERLLNDDSWEDINRRVERLIEKQFFDTKIDDELDFRWASARIKANVIHLSYANGSEQRLLEFNWDGETEESALKRARSFRRERFPD